MSPPDDLLEAALEERDYYRAVAEQVGRKVLSDFSDLSRLITTLKRTETLLRSSGDELERKVEERTHAVMHANAELRAEVIERARAESSARESEEMYRLLAETSPDSITVVDLSSAIIMLNQQALHLYGIPAVEDAIGRSIFQWVPPGEQEKAALSFQRVLSGEILKGLELELTRHDGESFWASVNASLARRADGEPRFVIIVSTDITARKRAEAERLRSQKLESLGVLAGGIAHDFNNLLTAILGNIGLGLEFCSDDDLSQCLADAERASLRARDLTQQLLTFSRGGSPVKRRLSPLKVLAEAAQFGSMGANVRCELQVADDLWSVEADEGQLAQVLNNLVINAVQAMPEGGRVGIVADNRLLSEGTLLLPPGRYVRIRVSDSGVGIPSENLQRIFDPYFTTKSNGSGLGLAVAYSVVKSHFGSLEVDSQVERGSTFTLLLPACAMKVSSAPARARIHGSPTGKVLVVDDDPAVREVLVRLLTALGSTVVAVADGEAGVREYQEARKLGEPFALAIVDLTIPGGMGGREAVERIRAIDPEVKAVVSSGYSNDPVLAEYRAHGFCGVLPKPYKVSDLRRVLGEVLGERP
ncbi:MAG: PAS domain S-box protein [Polyangiaceae bacterium]